MTTWTEQHPAVLRLLAAQAQVQRARDELRDATGRRGQLLVDGREHGLSWRQLGEALGMSADAARVLHGRAVRAREGNGTTLWSVSAVQAAQRRTASPRRAAGHRRRGRAARRRDRGDGPRRARASASGGGGA